MANLVSARSKWDAAVAVNTVRGFGERSELACHKKDPIVRTCTEETSMERKVIESSQKQICHLLGGSKYWEGNLQYQQSLTECNGCI
jgi:hypothetical protein